MILCVRFCSRTRRQAISGGRFHWADKARVRPTSWLTSDVRNVTSYDLTELVSHALAEDVGPGDVTTDATVAADARGRATITQKAPGAIYGLDAAEAVFLRLDPDARSERLVEEGEWREDGGPVMTVEGKARALLTGERTALNFLAHLSGVATIAARAAKAVEGTGAKVLDTRKTTPGLRALEKAAVAAGGASNHRAGLYDAILIKENHIAAAGGIAQAISRAREAAPELGDMLEVEVRNPGEIDEALAAGAPKLLLDNMDDAQLRAAVAQVAHRAELEASGGVTLQTLRARAQTGVEWVSMGALTHSAPALDLSLILEALP
jgi:nicotinate-nucleotide pyrophosphorylase (carboxylating)